MVILDGHKSHVSAPFEDFCKVNKIIPIFLQNKQGNTAQRQFYLLQLNNVVMNIVTPL